MSRNGSGSYSAPASSWNPAVTATTIDSSDFNTLLADLETALSESVARDGQTATTAVVPFASGIKADTIAENSSNTGVTVDGVLIKDSGIQLGAAGTLIFEGATANAFETTLTVVDPSADRTVTIPDATLTVVGVDTTQTLTNKTLTAPVLTSAVLNTAVSGTAVLDEDNMATDSDTQIATQQSIKAYVDAGAVSQANQAAIEAETNEDTYIPPDLLKHNPGVAKGWVQFAMDTTILASQNVTSVDDDATANFGINWTTAFSSAQYVIAFGVETTAASNNAPRVPYTDGQTAGAADIILKNNIGGYDEDEVTSIMAAAYGDQ